MVRKVVGRVSREINREINREPANFYGPKPTAEARTRNRRKVSAPRNTGLGGIYVDDDL